MGAFYIRMPKTAGQPEHWQLISSNLSGPPSAGQLKLRAYNGWARHTTKSDPTAKLLRLRNRKGNDWLPTLYMDAIGPNLFMIEYRIGQLTAPDPFLGDTGWRANSDNTYEYRLPDFSDPDGPGVPYDNGPTGVKLYGASNFVLQAQTLTAMGWTGDSLNTHVRYRNEFVSWYALPVGMLLDDAETIRELTKVNDPTAQWAKKGSLYRVDIVHHLVGFSANKSQMPWMPFYYDDFSTIGLYPGVGSVRYVGPTPTDFQQVYPFKSGVYTVPVVRNRTFDRDSDGDLVWAGSLNDLGANLGFAPGQSFTGPGLDVTQSLDITSYDVHDSLLFKAQTSPLPDPETISYNYNHSIQNTLSDEMTVRVVYAYTSE